MAEERGCCCSAGRFAHCFHERQRTRVRAEYAKQSGAICLDFRRFKARPNQPSLAQVHVAGFVRILCVAREGAYRTLHERPLRTRTVGGVGGDG